MAQSHTRSNRFRAIRQFGPAVSALLMLTAILVPLTGRTSTPQIVDSNGEVVVGSIAEERRIELGGVEQTVYLRGRDRSAPLLVFVHGGPGATATPFLRTYNAALEDDFVMVYWDQRGTAKSYDASLDPADMTMAQLTADLDELIDRLLAEFDQEQVLLVAHSWGTIIGLDYAAENPHKVAAYITISQTTSQMGSDEIGYEWALAEARAAGNENAISQLEKIGPPPYTIEQFYTQRRWVNVLGGGLVEHRSDLTLLRTALATDEFSWADLSSFFRGNRFSAEALWAEQQAYDAAQKHQRLDVPIFMIVGRHDKIISPALGAAYFETLQAPAKELIWFEQSAHAPLFEEPKRFNGEVLRIAEMVGLFP